MTQVRNKTRADRIKRTEVADAWFEYLETIRGLSRRNYDEVEDWAWARLHARLRVIERAHSGEG